MGNPSNGWMSCLNHGEIRSRKRKEEYVPDVTLRNLATDRSGLAVDSDRIDTPVFDLRQFPDGIELHGVEYSRIAEGWSLSKKETIQLLKTAKGLNRKVMALFAGEKDGEEKFVPYASVEEA